MLNKIKKNLLSLSIATVTSVVSVSSAQAGFLDERQLAVGFQGSGPSVKMPLSETVKAQLIIGALGSVNAIEARGLKTFGGTEAVDYYGYASVGMWSWDGGYYSGRSETAFGAGLGVGLDYDIRNLDSSFPPIFISGEIGASFVSWDNYNGFDLMSLGFGIHYQF